MTGLFKAEMKRLSKSRSLIVCMVISIILGVTVAMLYNYFWEQKGTRIAASYALMEQFNMDTEILDTALSTIPEHNLWSFVNIFFTDGSIWILSAICTCSFLASEYHTGTLKISVSRGAKRPSILLAKFFSGLINILLVTLAYVGSGTIAACFMVDIRSELSVSQMATILLMYFLLLAASAAVFLMLTVIFQKTGFAVAVVIAFPMIFSLLLNLISMVFENAASLSRFLLSSAFMTVQQTVLDGETYIIVLTALAYLLFSSVIGVIVFNKSEIK